MRKMYQKNGRNLETLTFSTLATANNTILGSNDHTISQSGYMTVAYLLHTGSGPVAGHENLTCSIPQRTAGDVQPQSAPLARSCPIWHPFRVR